MHLRLAQKAGADRRSSTKQPSAPPLQSATKPKDFRNSVVPQRAQKKRLKPAGPSFRVDAQRADVAGDHAVRIIVLLLEHFESLPRKLVPFHNEVKVFPMRFSRR